MLAFIHEEHSLTHLRNRMIKNIIPWRVAKEFTKLVAISALITEISSVNWGFVIDGRTESDIYRHYRCREDRAVEHDMS